MIDGRTLTGSPNDGQLLLRTVSEEVTKRPVC